MAQNLMRTEVLTGLVQDFKHMNLLGVSLMPMLAENRIPGMIAEWDVEHVDRTLVDYNVPGHEANRNAASTYTTKTAKMAYLRDKIPLSATTLRFLRRPGGPKDVIAGEQRVRAELAKLDRKMAQRVEWSIWQMLSIGSLTVSQPVTGNEWVVDYSVPATNKVTVGTAWSDFTNSDPAQDIEGLIAAIEQNGGQTPSRAVCGRTVMGYLINNTKVRELMRNQYGRQMLESGYITKLCGLDLQVYNGTYKTSGGTVTPYIAADKFVVLPPADNTAPAFDLMEGSSMDLDAPENHRGKFSKMWVDKDPSVETVLIDWPHLPVAFKPSEIGWLDVIP